jgi:hypothetical protein
MTEQHSITPPPTLVEKWYQEYDSLCPRPPLDVYIATRAAQWSADQEREAIIHWLITGPYGFSVAANHKNLVHDLRAARLPKPLTLAEQVTAKLDDAVMRGDCITTTDAMPLLRAAIKRLAELETPHD